MGTGSAERRKGGFPQEQLKERNREKSKVEKVENPRALNRPGPWRKCN